MAVKRSKATAKATTKTKSDSILQLKITLLGSEPAIWRRLLVPADKTLGDLNYMVQVAMGWTNSHLHQFKVDKVCYADPRFELEGTEDEFAVRLGEFAGTKARLLFEYDFGDGWKHDIKVEKVLPKEAGTRYPVCVGGERACPPEDCGGVWGYEELLEAIRDPKHEQHEEMLEWIGGSFDPEAFDLAGVDRDLRRSVKLLAS